MFERFGKLAVNITCSLVGHEIKNYSSRYKKLIHVVKILLMLEGCTPTKSPNTSTSSPRLRRTKVMTKQKQKYRGMFETQKSRNKTSSGDIGLNIRTLASPKVGQDQVSGGVSVLCWHATPVANVLWKPLAVR